MQNLLTSLDLIGTFTFAVTGAFKAVKYELDILGVLSLAVITGVGGGILRDLLLGVTPPVVFLNEIYLVLCLVGGLTVFFIAPRIARWWNVVKIFDAVGLGVFAALGALKGFEHHLGVLGTLFMGALTAVGGGAIRDLL
ncbi:MAG: trimeric intracellular cation channel family protein, partial [Spirochaetales bacterium]|nr:trimeric intracellular cation channel family protein [Spirochaetales bacterium]